MRRSPRRLIVIFLALPIVVAAVATAYGFLMATLEGETRTFWSSVSWASETLTSTGYGHDNSWTHPGMIVFVVMMQFMGVGLVFLVLPLFLVPYIEEYVSGRLPRTLPRKIREYALIYRYGAAVDALIERLRAVDIPTVIFEEDEATARRLLERDYRVVFGSIDAGAPEPALFTGARFVVANGTDHDNGAVIIAARQHGFKGEIVALAQDPFHRPPMVHAGANAVYTPRHILAAALAARASDRINPKIAGIRQLRGHVSVSELRIPSGSELVGQLLDRALTHQRGAATIIGFWRGGQLTTESSPDARVEAGDILVAIGPEERLARLEQHAQPLPKTGPLVVVGFGEVGHKIVEFLGDAGETLIVINKTDAPGVDHVGDALDQAVLERAGIKRARAIIVALSSDSVTMFATTIIRNIAPRAVIIARVNRSMNLDRIHRAGADFALSVSEVSGQLLAHHLLKDESIRFETRIKLIKLPAGRLAQRTLDHALLQRRTNCSLIAVERGDKIIVDFDEQMTLQLEESDDIYICGPVEAVDRFRKDCMRD
jgi:Trk K+ transport system NAD-binding subunit